MPQVAIRDADYRTLALVRAELRAFAHFTKISTGSVGLTPQQHQILLALRAAEGGELTIGELAATMLLKPHSVSGMADRLAGLGLVKRTQSASDRRRVILKLTGKAQQLLASLGHVHRAELRRIRPLLNALLAELD
jgi:DNA-binding MarR family transcriptional regulator